MASQKTATTQPVDSKMIPVAAAVKTEKLTSDKTQAGGSSKEFGGQSLILPKDWQSKGPRIVRKEDRVTPKYLSRFERVRLIGARASELSQGRGEPPMLDWTKVKESSNAAALTDALAIAEEELRQGVLPLDVRRVRADGSCEDWSVDELIWEDSSYASFASS